MWNVDVWNTTRVARKENWLKIKEFKENNIDVTKKYEYIAEHVSSIAIFWNES